MTVEWLAWTRCLRKKATRAVPRGQSKSLAFTKGLFFHLGWNNWRGCKHSLGVDIRYMRLVVGSKCHLRKTDVPLQLWQRYPYRHNLSFLLLCISSLCLCKYDDDLCTDAISFFLICSASHTLSLTRSVSPLASSLSPPLRFAYKPMANLFVLSLIAIKSSDKHRCFTQRAENNINLTPSPHSKDDQYWSLQTIEWPFGTCTSFILISLAY